MILVTVLVYTGFGLGDPQMIIASWVQGTDLNDLKNRNDKSTMYDNSR
jgi:hypothetical protein